MNLLGPAAPWEFRWRIPIIFLSLPAVAFAADLGNLVEGSWLEPEVARWKLLLGACLSTLGVGLRLWATQALSTPTMLSLEAQTRQFVTQGPFALIRNPLYLGTMLIVGGLMLWYGWLLFLVTGLIHAWRFHRISEFEGRRLTAEWGAAYREYETAVPRWIPRRICLRGLGCCPVSPSAVLSNLPFVALMLSLWVAVLTLRTGFVFPFLGAGLLATGAFLLCCRLPALSARRAGGGLPIIGPPCEGDSATAAADYPRFGRQPADPAPRPV